MTGVTRFGLFVALDETGADGLLPMSSLPDDYYVHIEAEHRLVGRRWGRTYSLGERLAVRLAEANPITGGLILDLAEFEEAKPEPAEQADPAPHGWDPLRADKVAPDAKRDKRPPGSRRGPPRGAGKPPRRGARRPARRS